MLYLLIPAISIACTCGGVGNSSPCGALSTGPRPETEAVFVGKATRIYREFDKDPAITGPSWEARRYVEFAVSDNFHGAPHSTFAIEITGICDFQFLPGIEYLVYAHWWPQQKSWIASMCGRSGIALLKHGEIEVLRAASKAAILFGVLKGSRDRILPELVEGAKVQLIGGSQTLTATTNSLGDFTFTGLQSGDYELVIDSPGWRFKSPRKVALYGRCVDLELFGEPLQVLFPPLPQ